MVLNCKSLRASAMVLDATWMLKLPLPPPLYPPAMLKRSRKLQKAFFFYLQERKTSCCVPAGIRAAPAHPSLCPPTSTALQPLSVWDISPLPSSGSQPGEGLFPGPGDDARLPAPVPSGPSTRGNAGPDSSSSSPGGGSPTREHLVPVPLHLLGVGPAGFGVWFLFGFFFFFSAGTEDSGGAAQYECFSATWQLPYLHPRQPPLQPKPAQVPLGEGFCGVSDWELQSNGIL